MRQINRRDLLKLTAMGSAAFSLGINSKSINRRPEPYVNPLTGEWVGDFLIKADIKAKLNANENPYGQSPLALAQFKAEMKNANRYGSAVADELRTAIAKAHQVSEDHVMVSAGSLELLQLAALTFGHDKGNFVSAFPTFEPLLRNAQAIGCDWRQVDVDQNLKHDLGAMEKAIDDKTSLVYLCNPNNPTGTLHDPEELASFCKLMSRSGQTLFVDEAYNEFLDEPEKHTMLGLVKEGYNVIICKTFSKLHGFAGLRIGYVIGHPDLINQMKRYRNFATTMTRPSMKAAITSLLDDNFLDSCRTKNNEAREFTKRELRKRGFEPSDSYTSFMVFPIPMSGEQFISKMASYGVAIRSWEFQRKQWCRVSVGTMENMKDFLSALDKALV